MSYGTRIRSSIDTEQSLAEERKARSAGDQEIEEHLKESMVGSIRLDAGQSARGCDIYPLHEVWAKAGLVPAVTFAFGQNRRAALLGIFESRPSQAWVKATGPVGERPLSPKPRPYRLRLCPVKMEPVNHLKGFHENVDPLDCGILSLGFASAAQAQQARLFFEGDIVRGDQDGAPGPGCALNSQFKHLEKVVWRLRILDSTGKALDDKGLKSLIVELPDGQKMAARFGAHPPPRVGPAVDHFWTARWIIPAEYPTGSFYYKVVATDLNGNSQTWEPFRSTTSQLTVVDGAIEFKK